MSATMRTLLFVCFAVATASAMEVDGEEDELVKSMHGMGLQQSTQPSDTATVHREASAAESLVAPAASGKIGKFHVGLKSGGISKKSRAASGKSRQASRAINRNGIPGPKPGSKRKFDQAFGTHLLPRQVSSIGPGMATAARTWRKAKRPIGGGVARPSSNRQFLRGGAAGSDGAGLHIIPQESAAAAPAKKQKPDMDALADAMGGLGVNGEQAQNGSKQEQRPFPYPHYIV